MRGVGLIEEGRSRGRSRSRARVSAHRALAVALELLVGDVRHAHAE